MNKRIVETRETVPRMSGGDPAFGIKDPTPYNCSPHERG